MTRFLGCSLVAAACLLSTEALAAWEVGVAPATRKILPDTPMPTDQQASLEAARNEWEAFQIVIRDDQGVSGVNVELSDLTGTKGALVPASSARLYREYYVNVTTASPFGDTYHERSPGLYPDPLIPFNDPYHPEHAPVGAPFDLQPGETGTVFVDWYVPAGTLPGNYQGKAVVSSSDGQRLELPVKLTIWEIDIPKERTIATAFGYSRGASRGFHGGPGPDPDPGFQTIDDRYFLALHEHRLDSDDIAVGVNYTFDAQDNLEPVDWSDYDTAVGPFMDGSRFPDGIGVTRLNVASFTPGRGTGSMTEAQYQQAARALAEHLQEKGWWDRAYVYAIDEPWGNGNVDQNYTDINRDAALLFAASDLWRGKVLVTGPYTEAIADSIGIWCPVTPMYDHWWYFWEPKPGWDAYTPLLAQGEELWFYLCNHNTPPYAGYDIDTRIGYEPRIANWGTWYERATGLLYWRVHFWVNDDPWNTLLDLQTFGQYAARNGDGFLLYPGDHNGTAGGKGSPDWLSIDGPILSYRLKQIRDGLEDWELFRMASAAGGEDFVRTQVRRAYQRFGNCVMEDCSIPEYYCPDDQPWTLDENVLQDARRQVAAKLLALRFPGKYPDPEAPAKTKHGCGCQSESPGGGPLGFLLLLGLVILRKRQPGRVN